MWTALRSLTSSLATSPRAMTRHKYGDNGVLTEVFYDNDDDSVVITEVNTYVGEITKTVKATDKKDAYVVVTPESEKPTSFKNEFETDDKFDDDDLCSVHLLRRSQGD